MGEARSEQRLVGDRIIERLDLIWATIFYASLGLCLLAALFGQPEPPAGWRLALLLTLCGLSAGQFQGIFLRQPGWPMGTRAAWIYFGGQLLTLAGLLALSDSFIGLGFALMGQAFGALRPRWWALPLVPLVLILAGPMGWLTAATRADWLDIAGSAFVILIWVLLAALLAMLFSQRYQLLDVVAELRRAKAALEAAAAQQEELAVLRERTRLAREMHDSLGHALVSVNVKLEAAQRLYRVDQVRGDAELEATRALVRSTMGELRRSLADLRAPAVDHHDLPAALHRLAAEASARGAVAVSADSACDDCAPPPAVAEALFLIAREALLNVERHAAARHATIALHHLGDAWRLEVADDGVGVRPADLRKPGHFGVLGMRERAEALGGKLAVTNRPEGGTLVQAIIPDPGVARPAASV